MYEFVCKRCGRRYWSASGTPPEGHCQVCGGELQPTGVEGKGEELPPASTNLGAATWCRVVHGLM
jgi:PHP family Zn ribbon phosphoesterase